MNPAELLMNLGRLGIRLEADGDRLRYSPRSALTPDLADRLKAYKAELLALLRPTHEMAPAQLGVAGEARAEPTKPVCQCGSPMWRDWRIHGGQSTRRDCGRCRRFIDFPIWYGKDTVHKEQHLVECQRGQETNQPADRSVAASN